jgi:hypothetical protein
MLSIETPHRLRVLAVVVALAALLVPAGLAHPEPVDQYGPLDPWAFNLVRTPVPLVTEHAAGQNGSGHATLAVDYGPLDPWLAALIERAAPSSSLVTDHSASQNGVRKAIVATSAPMFDAGGFAWRDAGIGAGTALGAVLLALSAVRLVVRRTRVRPAGF